MKGFIGLAVLLLLFSAGPAAAQQPIGTEVRVGEGAEKVLEESGIAAALDSLAATSTPELEQALGDLADALGGLATRIANDPELRRSAVQAAQGMVGLTQVVVAEQSRTLQEILRAVAEELEALPAPAPPAREPR